LKQLFIWRLKIENPEEIELTVDLMREEWWRPVPRRFIRR
jgi:hypothetical protein